jgi:hypothetical protein
MQGSTDLSMAVTSKLGMIFGPEEVGVDWAEHRIAAHSRNTTEEIRIGMIASQIELSSGYAPTARWTLRSVGLDAPGWRRKKGKSPTKHTTTNQFDWEILGR